MWMCHAYLSASSSCIIHTHASSAACHVLDMYRCLCVHSLLVMIVCMYVCTCGCMDVCMDVWMCWTCIDTQASCLCVQAAPWRDAYVCVRMDGCMHVCTDGMYGCIHVCTDGWMYVWTHIDMYACMHALSCSLVMFGWMYVC